METLSDITVEGLEVIHTEMVNFLQTSAYRILTEALEGKTVFLEKDIIATRPTSIVDLFNREAAIGEAREASRQIDFLQDFLTEVSELLKEKQKAPSH